MSSIGYENAPATRLMATHCCICSRALVDAASVEAGMGPHCRDKHGYNEKVSPEARAEANRLVHWIAAAGLGDVPGTVAAIERLRVLGLGRLAEVLAERTASVQITETADGRLAVTAPFNEETVAAWRTIPGRRWDVVLRANLVPASSRAQLWAFLRRYHAGQVLAGPKGLVVIPA